MTTLLVFGSKRGGTAGLAYLVATALSTEGIDTEVRPARQRVDLGRYDAVIVGGPLYMGRWHRDARRFVRRHASELANHPVWFFSSGPLDDSAARTTIPPVPRVAALMKRVGAVGHVTFGGRLAADATGFPASAMAKKKAGDWRDTAHVERWVHEIASGIQANTARR